MASQSTQIRSSAPRSSVPARAPARELLLLLLAPLPLLLLDPPPAHATQIEHAPNPAWSDVELPRGFQLDLASGLVTNAAHPGDTTLSLRAGRLETAAALYRLPSSETPAQRIERGGEALAGTEARPGLELVYDLGERGWGYLRVLRTSGERVALERVHAPAGTRVLERRPATASALSRPTGVELSWRGPAGADASTSSSTPYRIERRFLERGPGEAESDWQLLAETQTTTWTDPEASSTRIAEYRVQSLAPGLPFGARARGVAQLAGPEEVLHVTRGQELSLITGRDDPERVDLRVQHASGTGIQVSPGPGVLLRPLSLPEEALWRLPPAGGDDWSAGPAFVAPERSLAAYLPEGIYARLRVELGPGGEPRLLRQLDLSGGRTFPPPPPAPRAEWDPTGGLTLHLDGPVEPSEPGLPRPELEVELEAAFESGDWRVLASRPLARSLELGHLLPTGLARLRLRYRLESGETSLASPDTLALVGDDDAAGFELLVGAALEDLASPDYRTRRRAHGTLQALGARAVPRLREALGSDEPHLAAAAREVLGSLPPEDEDPDGSALAGSLAPLLLRARAEADGLSGEPPPGWFDPLPSRRALAILRRPPGEELPASQELADWRRLSAAADPDPRVRRLASLVPTLAPLPAPPAWLERLLAELHQPLEAPRPLASLRNGRLGTAGLAQALAAGLVEDRPWVALARLAALHELARTRGTAEEEPASEAALLVLALLERHAEGGEDAFLDAARQVVQHPAPRLAALRSLADLHLGPQGRGPRAFAGPREQRELLEPSAAALAAALAELDASAHQNVDLWLPAGIYEPEGAGTLLRTGARGLRLLARGEVVLRAQLYVGPGAEVSLEGLRLAPASGIAVTIARGAARLVDCVVVPAQLGIQLSDGFVVLRATQIVREGSSATSAGIRAGGESLVLLRDALIDAGGAALTGARLTLIERSVLVASSGAAVSGVRDAEAWVLDSLLAGTGAAIGGLGGGLLEGGLLASEGQAGKPETTGLHLCPEHTHFQGPVAHVAEAPGLSGCPVGR